MAFCTECGANVPDGVKFCTGCGSPMKLPAAAPPTPEPQAASTQAAVTVMEPIPQPAPQPSPPPQPVAPPPQQTYYQPPAAPQPQVYTPAAPAEIPPTGKFGVMSVLAYIGTMILFALPFIGWLACIIMAFAPKNQNLRNFSRAMLVFLILGLILSVIAYFVIVGFIEGMYGVIKEATGATGEFSDLGSFWDLINMAG